MKTTTSALVLLGALGLLCGCATNTNSCVLGNSFKIDPNSFSHTANHLSKAPANQVKFGAVSGPVVVSGSGCAVPLFLLPVNATWTTSDPKDVIISSAADETNGLATCVNATNGPVTVTATAPAGSTYTTDTATTTLTCN